MAYGRRPGERADHGWPEVPRRRPWTARPKNRNGEALRRWVTGRRATPPPSLRRAALLGADLRGLVVPPGTNFTEAWLDGCDLSGGVFEGVDFYLSRMIATSACDAQLTGASLKQCAAPRSLFRRATLDGACLDRASFHDADLSYASVDGASLVTTHLVGCNLSGVALEKADVLGCRVDSRAMATLGRSPEAWSALARHGLRVQDPQSLSDDILEAFDLPRAPAGGACLRIEFAGDVDDETFAELRRLIGMWGGRELTVSSGMKEVHRRTTAHRARRMPDVRRLYRVDVSSRDVAPISEITRALFQYTVAAGPLEKALTHSIVWLRAWTATQSWGAPGRKSPKHADIAGIDTRELLPPPSPASHLLARFLEAHFDFDELGRLAGTYGLATQLIHNASRRARAHELVALLDRHGRLTPRDFFMLLVVERPVLKDAILELGARFTAPSGR